MQPTSSADDSPVPPERRRAWQAFFEAHAAVVPVLEAEMQTEHGLSLRWYDVLLQLAAAPGRRLLMHELSDAVVISKGGLTKLVDRMAAAGLVEREAQPGNRRVTPVRLTPHGLETYRRARLTHHRGVAQHFLDHLSDTERAALVTALERVRDAALTDSRS
ncbi:MAG: MarR family winged helix-turn-helix transcriptional regulator [Gaiellales bacterium]